MIEDILRRDGTPGAVVSIQTFGNLVDLNPHIHMIVSWGCFDNRGTFYAVREVPDDDTMEQIFLFMFFLSFMLIYHRW